MKLEKTKKFIFHSPTISTWFSFLTRSLSILLVLPLLLKTVSINEANLWFLILTIQSLQTIVDFGFQGTFIRFISYGYGGMVTSSIIKGNFEQANRHTTIGNEPNWKSITEIWNALSWFYNRVSFVFPLVFAGIMYFSFHGIIAESENPGNSIIILTLSLAGMTVSFFSSKYSIFLQGTGFLPQIRNWEGVFNILSISFSALILLVFENFFLFALSYFFWVFVSAARLFILYRKNLSHRVRDFVGSQNNRVELLKVCWQNAWKVGLGSISSYGVLQFTGIIATRISTGPELAAYLLTLRVLTMINDFARAPFYSRIPELSRLYANNDQLRYRTLINRSKTITLVLFASIICFIIPLQKPLLNIIGSKVSLLEGYPFIFLALALYFERAGALFLQELVIMNKLISHIVNTIAGMVILTLIWILTPDFQLTGISLSLFLANSLFYSVPVLFYYYRVNGSQNIIEDLRLILLLPLLILIPFYLTL